MSELSHAVSAQVRVPPQLAFAYLADGIRQGEWTLGSWDREHVTENIFRGRSLFDGHIVYVRVLPDPERLIIDYEVGPALDQLNRRISARIIPEQNLRRSEDSCVVTLTVWRAANDDDYSWQRTCDTHRAEIHLIKGRLETQR
jgi:hypothetical protein